MGLATQFFMSLNYKYVKIYAFSNTNSFYYRNTDLNFEKVAHVSLNMSKLSVKEQMLCINANYLQATLCYLTGQQLAHSGGREGKKQKYLYLTKVFIIPWKVFQMAVVKQWQSFTECI